MNLLWSYAYAFYNKIFLFVSFFLFLTLFLSQRYMSRNDYYLFAMIILYFYFSLFL